MRKHGEFLRSVVVAVFAAFILEAAKLLWRQALSNTVLTFIWDLWPIWGGIAVGAIVWFVRDYIALRKWARLNMKLEGSKLAWQTAVRHNIEQVRIGAQLGVNYVGHHEKWTTEAQQNNRIKTEWPEEEKQ